jgi:hypothetical protein
MKLNFLANKAAATTITNSAKGNNSSWGKLGWKT